MTGWPPRSWWPPPVRVAAPVLVAGPALVVILSLVRAVRRWRARGARRSPCTLPIDVLSRDWAQVALTAPTAAERITAGAAMGRQIMERTGALFAVAQQAAAVEPLIAAFWQQGREQSRYAQAAFWTRAAEDGLLGPDVDLAWVIDTASLLGGAETYLLVTRMLGWDLDAYESWLVTTWTWLAAAR